MRLHFDNLINSFNITLNDETEARYLCLLEGLEYIDKKLDELRFR